MAILLDTFPEEEHINQVHPILGTPLCIAAVSSNVDMVTALLEKRASPIEGVPDIDAFFNACGATFGIKVKPEHKTPLWIALAVFESLLQEKVSSKERLDVAERIISKLLFFDMDVNVDAKWKLLRERIGMEEEEKRKTSVNTKDKVVAREESGVVDLSVMTEEKPSGWREGVESTQEMSMRTFLRYFRSGE